MKIVSIQVDGFGHLRDRTWQLDGAITLVYGANEAGKSTLMGFVRAILFGFAPRSQLADRYVPLGGGAHGGSLILVDDQGKRVLVERHDQGGVRGRSSVSAGTVKVTFEDGSVGGEDALAILLGGMSAEVFRSLFAFGLTELQELRNLQKEEINGYLYSAGLGIPPAALMDSERKLVQRLEQLYKPKGKKQDLNVGFKKLEELDAALRRSKEHANQYEYLKQDVQTVEVQIEELENKKKLVKERLDWLQTCYKAFEPAVRLQELKRELEELPAIPEHFPEDVVGKWESIQAETYHLQEELQQVQIKLDELMRQLQEHEPNEEVLSQQSEIEILLERMPIYQNDERTMITLQSELEYEGKELARTLRSIDPSWSEFELQQFALSAAMREQLNKWKEQFAQLAIQQQRESLSHRTVMEQIEKQESKIHELQMKKTQYDSVQGSTGLYKKFIGIPGIQDMKKQLRTIRQMYNEYHNAMTEYRHLKQRAEDYRMHQEALLSMQRDVDVNSDGLQSKYSTGSALGKIGAMAGAIVGIGLAVWLFVRGDTIIAAILGIMVFAGCLGYYQLAKSSSPKSNGRGRGSRRYVMDADVVESGVKLPSDLQFKLAHVESQIEKLCEALSVLVQPLMTSSELASSSNEGLMDHSWDGERKQRGIDDAMLRREDHQLGFTQQDYTVSDSMVRQRTRSEDGGLSATFAQGWMQVEVWLAKELAKWEEGFERWERDQDGRLRITDQLAENKQELQVLAKQSDDIANRVAELHHEDIQLQDAWAQWLKQYGFSAPLTPSGLLESLPLIEQGHSLLFNKQRLQTRLAAVEGAAREYAAQVDGLLGIAAVQEGPILGIKRRGEALAQELRKREAAARASEAQRAAALEAQALSTRLEGLQLRESELLALASAESEADLRVKARHAQRRAELLGEQRHLLPSVTALVGSQRLQELYAMLAEHGKPELAALAGEQETAHSLLSEEANELRDRRGRLAGQIEQLEGGAGHGDKLQRREEQVATLQALGREYATCAIAAHLLRKAREMYERERQPGVLTRASRYFAEMTGGRFVGVRAPFGENKLEAVKPSGQGVEPAFLSRGTAEQMYLAMRFALAEEYASRAVVPMIMDDILVNFDQQRMERCLKLLQEISGQRQLLLFTCHEHVRDAALRHIPGLQLIEL
ncbi:AAA family ATPase [Paenibacillus sp. N1-5-1-14]|uniref:AAA family ATPase n=1 Tax=Paenibacillus radicibacter TaxID=2972488 RepID=UPI002158B665|nr:AAA family ATPase [Paenibacillus radicibacter]MCR8643917.1 AAA family ATPase [Paenibacillus radicibacter]